MTYTGTGPSGQLSVLYANGNLPYFERKEQEKIVSVGKNGAAQFSSIKSAVDSILDSSSLNRYSVRVGPGTYIEAPITLPTYVNIRGEQNSVTIVPSDNNNPLIQMSGVNYISTLQMFTPSNSIGTVSNSGATTNLDRVMYLGPNIGTMCNAGASLIGTELVYNYLSSSTSGICFFSYGDDVILSTVQALSAGTGIFIKKGAFSISNFTIKDCDVGISIYDCVSSDARLGNLTSCQTGLFVGQNLGSLSLVEMGSVKMRDIGLYAVKSLAESGFINLASCQLRGDELSIANFSVLNMFIFDEKEGDEAARLVAELSVGLPEKGRESVFGEGDSYTRGMLVYQSGVASGLFYDVSTDARNLTSTFGFPANASGDAIYIASDLINSSDYTKFYGIKSTNDTLATLGSGSIVWERWNGAGWEEFGVMSTASDGDYMHFANNIWQNRTSEQIRFDTVLAASGEWVKNDPISDGTDRYWVRAVITNPLTSLPVFNQFKLHSSRTEINADGYIEFFGNARPLATIPFDINLVSPAVASPSNQDLYLSDTLDVGRTENSLVNNATDRIGFVTRPPIDMDTSSKLHLIVTFYGDGAAGGTIDFTVRYGYSSEDNADLIYPAVGTAPTTHSTQVDVAVPVTSVAANLQQTFEMDLDISNLKTRRAGTSNNFGDLLWISIERDGTGDAYAGVVNLVQVSMLYIKWALGGHPSSVH